MGGRTDRESRTQRKRDRTERERESRTEREREKVEQREREGVERERERGEGVISSQEETGLAMLLD